MPRADLDFLIGAAETAEAAGAERFRFADTLGVLHPAATAHRIRCLRAAVGIDFEMHAHDDFGLATANTLAAVLAGATHINTTVNGLGERAGNAPLEEAVMALRHLYNIETGIDARQFPQLSRLVACASRRAVSISKSIVGEGVFTHESGIHVNGLIKNPLNYQGFDPTEVGREHRVVLGKHSGSGAVRHAYAKLGIPLSDDQTQIILMRIRAYAVNTKRIPGRVSGWRGNQTLRGVAVVRQSRCLNPRRVSRFQSLLVEPGKHISRTRLSCMSLRPSLAPRLRDCVVAGRGRASHRDTRPGIGDTRCLASLAVVSAIAVDAERCTVG